MGPRASKQRPGYSGSVKPRATDRMAGLRRLLSALFLLGSAGLATELWFLKHYEDVWMILPLATIGLGLATFALRGTIGSPLTVQLFRAACGLMVVTGLLGAALHYQVGVEFQSDMDPTLSAGQLFWKVLRMKAPPMLAPGALAQLGLLGLVITYGLPAGRTVPASSTGVYP